MPDEPLHNMAGEPLPEGLDLFALGVRVLGFAASVGATAIALVLWGVQTLVPAATTPNAGPVAGPAFYLLVLGTPAAMALAGATCWFLLRPVQSLFRRGALSVVSAFLAFVVSLITLPANALFGRLGLLTASLLFAVVMVLFGRSLRRWSTTT
ncbi:MAG: hypothetical protein ACREL2_09125 [Gemmatimonadales bacterium]